jgi:hypothetical protein
MRKKRTVTALLLPHGVRAMVPVLAPVGGAGRSTVAGLLAQVLAPTTRTLVIDPAVSASSPWPGWLGIDTDGRAHSAHSTHPGHPGHPGLPTVLGDGPVAALASVVGRPVPLGGGRGRGRGRSRDDSFESGSGGPGGPGYDVLTDCRPLIAPPVTVPDDPRWYADVLEAGSWFAGVIDLGTSVPAAHVRARHAGRASVLDLWWRRSDAVPVAVLPSSAEGARAMRRLVGLLERDGLSPARVVLAVVDIAGPDLPRRVRAQITGSGEAERSAPTVVHVPYDPAIRAHGLSRLDLVSDAVLDAITSIARIIVSSVRPHREVAGGGPGEEPTEERGRGQAAPTEVAARTEAVVSPDREPGTRTRAPGWVPVRHRVAAAPYDPAEDPDSQSQP